MNSKASAGHGHASDFPQSQTPQSHSPVSIIPTVLPEVAGTFDRAAKKSDRWWFFALLMVGIFWTAYYQYKQDQQLALRDLKLEKLEQQMLTTLNDVVKENTKAFQATTEMLRRVEQELLRGANR